MWSVELSDEDFVSRGVLKSNAKDWAGTNTYEFKDGQGVWRRSYGGQTDINICPFTYEVVEDFVRLTFHDTGLGNYACEGEWDDIQWSLDEEGLHFNVVNLHNAPIVEATAMYEAKPWQKVE
jgi:nuclear transport factor 2 (NTF2) superfamily protein